MKLGVPLDRRARDGMLSLLEAAASLVILLETLNSDIFETTTILKDGKRRVHHFSLVDGIYCFQGPAARVPSSRGGDIS
ncbi:hypothetical protein I7I53_01618 [Histoplasma capsulatum var. duboisii H88]|nr:hypothetical protein I7I53_01618 [Histoplasma capsulatum var. duboisii H88]